MYVWNSNPLVELDFRHVKTFHSYVKIFLQGVFHFHILISYVTGFSYLTVINADLTENCEFQREKKRFTLIMFVTINSCSFIYLCKYSLHMWRRCRMWSNRLFLCLRLFCQDVLFVELFTFVSMSSESHSPSWSVRTIAVMINPASLFPM